MFVFFLLKLADGYVVIKLTKTLSAVKTLCTLISHVVM